MKKKSLFFIIFIFFIINNVLIAQNLYQKDPKETQWVDSVFNSLNFEEKLGQLFAIRAHSNLGNDHVEKVENLIRKYHIGGLCFFQGTPEVQGDLTNRYQRMSKIPLMISIDGEWGVSMRLKESTITFPRQLMLGAIQNNNLIYRFGAQVAYECRRLGIHVNFAPVVDINNNPKNPVINDRSFGEDRRNVSAKAFMYMRGMQENGVLACAKHFPGHGDTETDSHYDLPKISHDTNRLKNIEMYPFRVLAQFGVGSMMAGHLQIPAIDSTANLPTSLSARAVTDILRKDIGFQGIIFTDGLEMKGVTKFYGNGEVEARALAAGNDVLLLPENVENSIKRIKEFIADKKIDTLELFNSVKRVLQAKYRLGLTTPQYVDLNNLRNDLNSAKAIELKKELIQNALTLVRNDDNLLPINTLNADSVATLAIGTTQIPIFQRSIWAYSSTAQQYQIDKNKLAISKMALLEKLARKKIVIVSLHDLYPKADKDFGLTEDIKTFVNELAETKKVILVVFGNPYMLKYFDKINNVLVAYNEDNLTQEAAAQSLFGGFPLLGKLPVTVSERARAGQGIFTNPKKVLQFIDDEKEIEKVGFDYKKLQKIDAVAVELIAKEAAPSCQILVAKDGKIVYHKAFGYHTYDKKQGATLDDLYDLASITKVAATTVSLMRLEDEGKIDLYKNFGDYLPLLRGSNKESLLLRDILTHQSGLKAWIPFYKKTLDTVGKIVIPSVDWYANKRDTAFSVPVTERLFMRKDYVDSIKQQIIASPLDEKVYRYSDLGMILMADLVKNVSGKTLDLYADSIFYRPLGMKFTLFNPLQKFSAAEIVPSDEDKYFRNQRIRGTVHDMGAAMLGGVSGHAGLFSNANDLAILYQMLLNEGEYGGIRYLRAETVRRWASRQNGSTRRGFGWDMKELDPNPKKVNMSAMASERTFGHTGFTGNAAYADPDKNLIFIFLSNRTYPDMNNNKLLEGNYRPRIQTLIYEALK